MDSCVKIRKSRQTKKDIKILATLDHELSKELYDLSIYWEESFPSEKVSTKWISKAIYDKSLSFYIAEIDRKPIGMICISFRELKYAQTIFIVCLYVLSESRNKKVATSLIEKVELIAKRNRAKAISLDVSKKNKLAIQLYKKFGFESDSFHMLKKL